MAFATEALACFPGVQTFDGQTVDGYMTVKQGNGCVINFNSLGPTEGVQIVQRPKNGTVDVGSIGRLRYRPKQGYVGSDTFTYTRHGKRSSQQADAPLGPHSGDRDAVAKTMPAPAAKFCLSAVVLILLGGEALACRIPFFRTLDNGDVGSGTMTAVSGKPCKMVSGPLDWDSITFDQRPRNGTVSVTGNGIMVYTSKAGFVGADHFAFTRRGYDDFRVQVLRRAQGDGQRHAHDFAGTHPKRGCREEFFSLR